MAVINSPQFLVNGECFRGILEGRGLRGRRKPHGAVILRPVIWAKNLCSLPYSCTPRTTGVFRCAQDDSITGLSRRLWSPPTDILFGNLIYFPVHPILICDFTFTSEECLPRLLKSRSFLISFSRKSGGPLRWPTCAPPTTSFAAISGPETGLRLDTLPRCCVRQGTRSVMRIVTLRR